jgi:hypothetical protein
MPEQDLAMINRHNCDLMAEAADNRLARPRATSEERRFTGLRIQVGRMLIIVGQMSSDLALSPSAASASRSHRT